MPRPRRTGAKSSPSDDNSSENSQDSDIVFAWQWEGDGGKWTPYSKELSAEMTKAVLGGKSKVSLDVGNKTKIQVVFDKMVQKNSTTGWERRIRCAVVDGSDCYCWRWQDENGEWNPYMPQTASLLEKALKAGDGSVEFTAAKRQYVVDLAKLEQKNKATSVARTVERSLCGSLSDDPASSSGGATAAGDDAGTSGTSRNKRKAATAAAAAIENGENDEDDDDSDSDSRITAKKAKYSGSQKGGKSGKSGRNTEPEDTVKTVVVKGKAPVDAECSAHSTHHVYHEGSDIYDVMLNQTNVGNNNNKFYLIQLLEEDGKQRYIVWFRWGRVGFRGQNTLTRCGADLEQAKKLFCQKFTEKTKNDWSSRKNFQKVAGKYDMVALDYSAKEEVKEETDTAGKANKASKVPESKLKLEIQALIKLICDIKEMEDAVIEMKYDTKRAPLGRLTADQIKAGYAALKKIDQLIEGNSLGQKLVEACNDFYTRIPHDFRMSRPPILRTKEEVKEKIKLLEALGDIEIALRILQESKATENPIDSQYKSLRCELQLMEKTDSMFKVIEDYVASTHAPTHNQYKMNVMNVFCLDRNGESTKFKDVGNRMLLWHGSRLTNMVGILSQGLRIAPPEAPVTGYMFGKGIYFADMSSKSANYCFASASRNVGLLLLCEVSLGNVNELLAADYNADNLPKGKHSVKGVGKIGPDTKQNVTLPDGVVVPTGKPVDTGISNSKGYTLNYNEYIVYDVSQVKMKYVVQIQFDFS